VYIALLSCFSTMIYWTMGVARLVMVTALLARVSHNGTALPLRVEPQAGFSRPSTSRSPKCPLDLQGEGLGW
jgi:hypothetical protein